MRPASIIWFERLFLASIGVALVAGLMTAALRARMVDVQTGGSLGLTLVIGWTIVVVAFNLAIWWFAARRASGLARWIAVAIGAVSVVFLLLALPALTSGNPVLQRAALVSAFAQLLGIAATVCLFRPDARAWFGDDLSPDDAA